MKKLLRSTFLILGGSALPDRIAIYLHEVREPWLPALKELCEFFLQENYQFVSPEDYLKAEQGKRVLITFDDAYQNWIPAAQILNEFEISATFYLTTGILRDQASTDEIAAFRQRVNREEQEVILSLKEARDLHEMGHRLGVHGHRHLNLSEVTEEEVRFEITNSFDTVSEITGEEPKDFAFTYGMPRYFPSTAFQVCKELGLERIAYGCGGLLKKQARPERIERTLWKLWEPLNYNLDSLRIDSRLLYFTGRDLTSDGKKMPPFH